MFVRVFLGVAFSLAVGTPAVAAPYTGNSAPCTSVSAPSTCKINLSDFMQSKFNYTYNGTTFTSDSTNLSAAANTARSSSFRYLKQQGVISYDYDANTVTFEKSDQLVREGFMNHPTLPNVLLHSKTQYSTTNGGPLEVFRWADGVDNAMYVTAEAQWKTGGFNSYDTPESAPTLYWKNRGYFWADRVMDVTRDGSNPSEWKSAVRVWKGMGYDVIGANGAKFARASDPNSLFRTFVRYLPSVSAADRGLNDGGGELPLSGTLEVLEVVVQRVPSKDAAPTWWEKFVYARQRLANGTYNSFGLVRFVASQDYSTGSKLKCVNGIPPASKANLKCGDDDLLLSASNHYNAFYNADDPRQGVTVKQWYDTVLAGPTKFQNDPKLVKRSDPADGNLPHNRGGFVPPGAGSDAKGTSFIGSVSSTGGDWLYLENTTFDQDWYIYQNSKDPLYAPATSPTNYCRDGYQLLGSMVVTKSYNGLTQQVDDTGALQWALVCGTGSNLLIQASNAGEASCPNGYVSRGWFNKPPSMTLNTCNAGVCTDQTAKSYVNFCVSASETQFQYPAPNP
jgi:hypothetical protein